MAGQHGCDFLKATTANLALADCEVLQAAETRQAIANHVVQAAIAAAATIKGKVRGKVEQQGKDTLGTSTVELAAQAFKGKHAQAQCPSLPVAMTAA